MYIKQFSAITKSDVASAGGKGASLGEMTRAGLPVPPGFVVTTEAFRQFSESKIPENVQAEVLAAFDGLGPERVAVRSSAVAEDSSSASWAGQFESFLNIRRDGLIEAIEECWKSATNERVQAYADSQLATKDQLALAVVVQQMIDSEVAGVMFTINPVTGSSDEVMIEATYGLGELLVQGTITPDNYLVSKADRSIIDQTIQTKTNMLVYVDSGTKEVEVPADKQDQPALTADQLSQLVGLGLKIEQHYGAPQDIEWAFEEGRFWIVQSRPVTT